MEPNVGALFSPSFHPCRPLSRQSFVMICLRRTEFYQSQYSGRNPQMEQLTAFNFAQHQQITYPCQPLRYITCMVLLETMPQFENVLSELYFKQSIGNASMSALVADILLPKELRTERVSLKQ